MALPTKLTLEIVTPDRALVREEVDEVELPGSEGYFGVLPGHTPLLATLKVGELWYRTARRSIIWRSPFGFVEVLPDRVTVLAQIAERAQDIDVAPRRGAPSSAPRSGWPEPPQPTSTSSAPASRFMKSLIRLQVATRARTRV